MPAVLDRISKYRSLTLSRVLKINSDNPLPEIKLISALVTVHLCDQI